MTENVQITRPDDRLTIKFKGEDRELFMSFARLNRVLAELGPPDNLTTFLLDPYMCDATLRIMLAPDAKTPLDDVDVGEQDITMDDYDAILTWVRDHLGAFFLKRFQQLGKQMKDLEPVAGHLVSSLTGSAASSSNGPSAGPSE